MRLPVEGVVCIIRGSLPREIIAFAFSADALLGGGVEGVPGGGFAAEARPRRGLLLGGASGHHVGFGSDAV